MEIPLPSDTSDVKSPLFSPQGGEHSREVTHWLLFKRLCNHIDILPPRKSGPAASSLANGMVFITGLKKNQEHVTVRKKKGNICKNRNYMLLFFCLSFFLSGTSTVYIAVLSCCWGSWM